MSQMNQGFVPPMDEGPRRPASIMVFGIINIVWGVLTLVSTPFTLISFFVGRPDDPFQKLLQSTPWLWWWIIGATAVSTAIGVLVLISGIQLMRDRRRGRTLGLVYAWANIAMTLVAVPIMVFGYMLPMVQQQSPGSPEYVGMIIGLVAGGCGMFIGLAYPVLLLIFLNRKVLKNYLAEVDPAR